RVADAEPFSNDAAEEQNPGGGAAGDDVAGDDDLFSVERGGVRGADADPSPGQAFAGVVGGVADKAQRDPTGEERAERLAGGAGEGDVDGVVGQTFGAVAFGDLVAEHGADSPVDVADRQVEGERGAVFQCARRQLDEGAVQGPVQAVVLRADLAAVVVRLRLHPVQDRGQVEPGRFPVV